MAERENPYTKIDSALSDLAKLSERGIAIIAAGHLSRILEEVLRSFFVQDKSVQDNLMDRFAPLESFYARIELAYASGLISKQERDDLNLIRDIRNEFAHQLGHEVSFEEPTIRDKCMRLQSSLKDTPGSRFTSAVNFLFLALLFRWSKLARRVSPDVVTEGEVQAFRKELEEGE